MTQMAQTSINDKQIPALMELVVLFHEQYMVCLIDVPQMRETEDLVSLCLEDYMFRNEKKLVKINSISGKCIFPNYYVMGFYWRPASQKVNDDFKEKIISLTQRQVEAAEEVVKEMSKGDSWKEES